MRTILEFLNQYMPRTVAVAVFAICIIVCIKVVGWMLGAWLKWSRKSGTVN
jgi:hypothetical protein